MTAINVVLSAESVSRDPVYSVNVLLFATSYKDKAEVIFLWDTIFESLDSAKPTLIFY